MQTKPHIVLTTADRRSYGADHTAGRVFIDEDEAAKLNSVHTVAQTIALNLRQRRLALGLSQFDVAARAKISQKYLSKLESSRNNGSVCPSAAVFLRLCEALNTPPDELGRPNGKAVDDKVCRIGRNNARKELSELSLKLPMRHVVAVKQLVEILLESESRKQKPKKRPSVMT